MPTANDALSAPLDPKRVKTRQGGSGRSLSYIETHDAIRTANEIFGFGGWGYEVVELVHLATEAFEKNRRTGTRVGYRAVVKVTALGITFSDVGYGDAIEYTDSAITPHELAAKEAVSDAVKRGLKNFGDQFGLGLYDKDAASRPATQTASKGTEKALEAKAGGYAGGKPNEPATPPQAELVNKLIIDLRDVLDSAKIRKGMEAEYGTADATKLTRSQAHELIERLKAKAAEAKNGAFQAPAGAMA